MKPVLKSIAIMSVCGAAFSAANAIDVTHEIQEKMAKHLSDSGVASLQVAVAQNGNMIFEEAVGYANIENQVLATSKTIYRTASISKWFSASAAMRLVEQRRLSLDAEVQQYCTAFPKKEYKITAKQLLTHTSGLRHYPDLEKIPEHERNAILLGIMTRYTDRVAPLESFKEEALQFEPETDWNYSSHGYRLLGCMLEGVSGKNYTELMQQQIFTPSNMALTVDDDAWAIIPNRASEYRAMKSKTLYCP